MRAPWGPSCRGDAKFCVLSLLSEEKMPNREEKICDLDHTPFRKGRNGAPSALPPGRDSIPTNPGRPDSRFVPSRVGAQPLAGRADLRPRRRAMRTESGALVGERRRSPSDGEAVVSRGGDASLAGGSVGVGIGEPSVKSQWARLRPVSRRFLCRVAQADPLQRKRRPSQLHPLTMQVRQSPNAASTPNPSI